MSRERYTRPTICEYSLGRSYKRTRHASTHCYRLYKGYVPFGVGASLRAHGLRDFLRERRSSVTTNSRASITVLLALTTLSLPGKDAWAQGQRPLIPDMRNSSRVGVGYVANIPNTFVGFAALGMTPKLFGISAPTMRSSSATNSWTATWRGYISIRLTGRRAHAPSSRTSKSV